MLKVYEIYSTPSIQQNSYWRVPGNVNYIIEHPGTYLMEIIAFKMIIIL
jgi:hypothetical protein